MAHLRTVASYATLLSVVLLLGTGCLPSSPRVHCQTQQEGLPCKVSFQFFKGTIFVEVTLNRKANYLFALDTGANITAIDCRVATELGLPKGLASKVEGTAGTIAVETAVLAEISLGKMRVRNLKVTVQDLSGFSSPVGPWEHGIIGTDFLKHFNLVIDYPNQDIYLSPDMVSAFWWLQGYEVPFHMDNGIPLITVSLPGDLQADLRIDTGAAYDNPDEAYIDIPQKLWRALKHRDPQLFQQRSFTVYSLGGRLTLPVAEIPWVRLGGYTMTRPYLVIHPPFGYFARPNAVGFISNNFLRHLKRVIFDFQRQRLSFYP